MGSGSKATAGREGQQPRRVTIYDVAAAAGVAASTVSRALARPGRVSAETAARVREAAATVGYQRAATAPALRAVPSRLLAIVVADINNPVFIDVVRGAEEAADEAGYTTLLIDARESDVRERRAAEQFIPAVDALVMASPRLSDAGIRAIAKHRPVVVLNRVVQGLPSVLTDNARGARRAMEHLGEFGHRDVSYLGGPESSWADGMRWRSVEEAGIELEMRVQRLGRRIPTVAGGEEAVGDWVQSPTSGVIAFNDIMAIGFIRGLRKLGLQVPEDVSVIGFDNSQVGKLATPALSSVASPLPWQGGTAVRNVLAIVGGARATANPVVLPTNLVVRESSGPAGRPRPQRNTS